MTDQTAAQVTAPERPPKVIPPHVP
ncbi:MAG: hypothetical protein JWQ97_35, partial [Phenylobacterium sp.]|nr:hypothetical protein [Phenylobacterium sp.]